MDTDEIERIYAEHRREGYGTVSPPEMAHFRDAIAEHRPSSFIEVGTASGLSAGLFLRMLDEHGGERFVTVDYQREFYADRTKEAGFLIPAIYTSGRVSVARRTGATSLDVPGRGEMFEMAFVDANHEHPWPLIDTLCLEPVLTGPKIMLHDDLNLYRHQRKGRGVGPKVLFDQFPDHRERYSANAGNVFSLRLALPRHVLERRAKDGFAVPWTLTTPLTDDQVERFTAILREHYSPSMVEYFEKCCQRYNVSTQGAYTRRPDRRSRGGRRAALRTLVLGKR